MWFCGRESREPSLAGKKQAWSPKDLDVQTQGLQTAFASEQAAPLLSYFSPVLWRGGEGEHFSWLFLIDVND